MRPLRLLASLALAASLVAGVSSRADASSPKNELRELRNELTRRERGATRFYARAVAEAFAPPRGSTPIRPPGFGATTTLDAVHAKHDITLDPATGLTNATLDLRIRAKGGTLTSVAIVFDEGLTTGDVTADGGRTVTADARLYSPMRMVQLRITPALADGEETTLRIPYGGTLVCTPSSEAGGTVCAKDADFGYFAHQSIFPFIFDPADSQSDALDSLTRDIVLRVPAGSDVRATGERVSETTEGASKTSTWSIDKPLSRNLGLYAFVGKLGQKTVARSVPTTFVFPAPEQAIDKKLATWSTSVLDFVERMGGGPLPFQRGMTLVRLPSRIGDPGTATFGMTLLNDSYARAGDFMYEETWAHENSHLFWGIVVPEASSSRSRVLSEGLATISQLEYSFGAHFAEMDRDLYFARRFVPIGIDLRTHVADLPPVELGENDTEPEGYRSELYTTWAYDKSAAALDHLRVTVGDDVFSKALATYVKTKSFLGATPADFKAILEAESGKKLDAFFGRWIHATTRPTVSFGFEPVAGGVDIELTKEDELPMTLEVWLGLDDGQRIKKHVDLTGTSTKVHLDAPAWVRTVSANPRHDLHVISQSKVTGDLDFDGETDGFDLLRCTPLVGKSYDASKSYGLWDYDETFDPRCDLDGNNRIDEDDIALVAESFGSLRGAK